MEKKEVLIKDSEYLCDIDITVQEWEEILQNKTVFTENYKDVLLKFYSEPHHKSTCKALGEKYNINPQTLNATILNFAKAVQKKLNRFKIIGTGGKPTYWIIPMKGRKDAKYFEWTIRPELVEAIENTFMNKETQYWTFKHKPGTHGRLGAKEIVRKAKELNSAIMQYEYGSEDSKMVSLNWNRIQQVKEGDYIFLRGDSHIYAFGKVIRPRKKANIVLSINETIENKSHGKYISGNYKGCIHFEESNVFYEDLSEGKEQWGQRIDVDKWRHFTEQGIYAKDEENYIKGESTFGVLREVLKDKAIKFMKELEKSELGEILIQSKELLLNNKNLILTGAPGTGKTYLAQKIANAMGTEPEFVQFHPSYDYTDFVEGLRPIKSESKEINFELKSGVFKSFCEEALRNLVNSKKSKKEIQKEKSITDSLSLFIAKIENEIAENGQFKLNGIGGKECAPIIEISDKYFITKSASDNKLRTSLSNIKEKYEIFSKNKKTDWNIHSVTKKLDLTYHQTYFFGFLKAFDNFLQENKVESSQVEKVERKNFVIIIDEINRAEVSKVFGELFFSIDPGYRGLKGKVKTQYANLQEEGDPFKDGFYVPENVYIIGTMNDIDRSVESMDFAMRRRFAWQEIKAPSSKNGTEIPMWDSEIEGWKMSEETKKEATKRIIALNDKIEKTHGLSPAFHIGPAYFLMLKNYNEDFEQLWNNHLEGVLFDYLRGMPENEKLLEELKAAYNNAESQENVENN